VSDTESIPPDAPAPPQGPGRSGVFRPLEPAEPSALPDERAARQRQRGEATSFVRWLAELLVLVAVAVVAAWAITTYLVQPFIIPSTSMENTLLVGDRVLVSKLTYRFSEPRYGDVVVFTSPEDGKTDLIKRVIAVAGQTVDVQDGRVIVDGKPLSEPYVDPDFPSHYDAAAAVHVPAGSVWVMGDNRANSKDSRYIGPIATSMIRGKAFAIYWPPSRIGGL
jgi:signal peptidase I